MLMSYSTISDRQKLRGVPETHSAHDTGALALTRTAWVTRSAMDSFCLNAPVSTSNVTAVHCAVPEVSEMAQDKGWGIPRASPLQPLRSEASPHKNGLTVEE